MEVTENSTTPDRPLDDFDGFESLVHVTECQEETEVHHCGFGCLVRLLQTNKVTMDSLDYHRLRGMGTH